MFLRSCIALNCFARLSGRQENMCLRSCTALNYFAWPLGQSPAGRPSNYSAFGALQPTWRPLKPSFCSIPLPGKRRGKASLITGGFARHMASSHVVLVVIVVLLAGVRLLVELLDVGCLLIGAPRVGGPVLCAVLVGVSVGLGVFLELGMVFGVVLEGVLPGRVLGVALPNAIHWFETLSYLIA